MSMPRLPDRPRRSASETLSDTTGAPLELPPGVWDPPPVRRGEEQKIDRLTEIHEPPRVERLTEIHDAPPAELPAEAYQPPVYEAPAPAVSRKKALWIIGSLIALVAVVLGVGLLVTRTVLGQSEDDAFAEAMKAYQEHKFGNAATQFKGLTEKFPDGERAPTYRFLAEWSGLAGRLHDPQADPAAALDSLETFLKEHKDDPPLKEFAHEVGLGLAKLAETFAQQHANPADDSPLPVAERLVQARDAVRKIAKGALEDADNERIDSAVNGVRAAVQRRQRRDAAIAQLRAFTPTAEGIREARRYLQELGQSEEFKDLPESPEAAGILGNLYAGHLKSVTYEAGGELGPAPPRSDESVPSVVFDQLMAGKPGGARADDPVRLALARGVLYALRQGNGSIKWARRVGIDTTALPVRVPPSPASSERILVLSSDSQTLTALDTDGNAVWQYRLSSPCLGRPVVVAQRAYLPTYDGRVHEIELARGGLLGRFNLGQHLTTGGAYDPGAKRLYFPADDSCVYVLDLASHTCPLILYTNHPAGSLRSSPLLISPPPEALVGDDSVPGFLVLNQARGLDAIQLKVYELPLTDAHQAPKTLDPDPRLDGWTWFRPYHDGEKVAVLSDAGLLGLFGIRQAKNKDQALFPLLKPGGLSLDEFLRPGGQMPGLAPAQGRGRSQVVHVNGDDYWVLAHGRLQRLGLAWSEREGPKAVAGWDKPLDLGSPLHESQVAEDPLLGTATLFVVTQALKQPTCLATAVEDEHGVVRWQRQLGVVCQGSPLALTLPDEEVPVLVALDRGGGLYALDPGGFPASVRDPWQSGGQSVAPSLDENPQVVPLLLAGPGGKALYEFACPGPGTRLLVRRVEWAGVGRQLRPPTDREVPLPYPLQGTPAVVGSALIMPLAGGTFGRLPLPVPGDARVEEAADWRSRAAPPDTPGHVAALGEDVFLTTDGGRGLAVWQWPADKPWSALPQGRREEPTIELENRVVSAPVVLAAGGGNPVRVCVADSGGRVTLLALRADGKLEERRHWDLQGQVTAGPFLRGPADEPWVGCVVNGRRLVWLDPGRQEKLWEYDTGGPAVVGLPQVVEDLVVVADQGGRFVGLDPATGKKEAPGYQLKGSVVPAASPVAFGPQRVFAPLSDGTALLLTLDRLRHPLRKVPGGT
jgi:outer membrane protein assembly factor BamB